MRYCKQIAQNQYKRNINNKWGGINNRNYSTQRLTGKELIFEGEDLPIAKLCGKLGVVKEEEEIDCSSNHVKR